MKPVLCVLLVTLAFCCYEANAKACPAVVKELTGLVWGRAKAYKISLQKYNAPAEAVEAQMKVKECTDKISPERRGRIVRALKNVVAECNR